MAFGLFCTAPTADGADIGVAEKVVKQVIARSLNKRLSKGDGLAFNEVVATEGGSAIEIVFTDDSRLILGEDAEIILDSMVYEPHQGTVKGTFRAISGVLRFKSAEARLDMLINTPSGTIGIRGTEFDLLTTPTATEISMLEGTVEVSSSAGTATVSSGQTYRMTGNASGFLNSPSPAMRRASARMLALINQSTDETAKTDTSTASASLSSSASTNTERLIMDLAGGAVVIEMRPDIAPKTVARMRELVQQGAFDGLPFQYVSPGYVAETALPAGAKQAIPAEFSNQPFEPGTLGMSRDAKNPGSATGKFFITLGRAKALDRKYTVWGKVVSGLEHLKKLKATKSSPVRETIMRMSAGN